MSSKRLCLTEDNTNGSEDNSCGAYQRNSFSDRFCDDLSEVILEWLPIEDKIRFTEVSQQFRRCLPKLWSKQHILVVDYESTNDRNNYKNLIKEYPKKSLKISINNFEQTFERRIFDINVKRMERVLQKYKNINEIRVFKTSMEILISNQKEVLNTIIKNCNHLQSIAFNFDAADAEQVQEFGHKFGQQIKDIVVFGDNFGDQPLIKMCPNLMAINVVNIKSLINDNEVIAKNVKKLRLDVIREKQHFFLIANNCLKLTHLDITFGLDSLDLSQVLKSISQLKDLKCLSIESIDCDSYDIRLAQSIESIAKNCKQMKCFSFNVLMRKSFQTKHFFEALKHFSSLKKLIFHSFSYSLSDNVVPNETLDINCWQKAKQLTHLELLSNQIDDNFFVNIDSVVPHLKSLKIISKDQITDKALAQLAKLKNLETIKMKTFGSIAWKGITDTGFVALVAKAKRLHTIEICNEMSITEKSIGALIDKSVQNPRVYHSYHFCGLENNIILDQIRTISSHSLKNISISGKHY